MSRRQADVCGCDLPSNGGGLCRIHYAQANRLRRYPNTVQRLPPCITEVVGTLHEATGYVRIRNQGVHRLVMEQTLGRPLLPTETVHHLNGDRADNRPENLELWTTSQPSGQRVIDKVRWAREFLALYPEMREAARSG